MQSCFLDFSDRVKVNWFQMQIKQPKQMLFKTIIPNLKDFLKKYKLKDDTMIESEFRKSL